MFYLISSTGRCHPHSSTYHLAIITTAFPMHLRFWQPRRRHAVMYHVTVWLLQPTCHLPRWGSWSRGSFSYSAGNTHHLNLFRQVTHRLKQHNSRSLAAMEVKGELPSKWRKTGFVVAIVSTEKQSRWFFTSSCRSQAGLQEGLGKGGKTASSERSTSIILTRERAPFPLNLLLALPPECQGLK